MNLLNNKLLCGLLFSSLVGLTDYHSSQLMAPSVKPLAIISLACRSFLVTSESTLGVQEQPSVL